ncbi:MAG: hypothetical protein RL095_397 [Verrucomicrobiota bacterium]|jgi:hypothetical protein
MNRILRVFGVATLLVILAGMLAPRPAPPAALLPSPVPEAGSEAVSLARLKDWPLPAHEPTDIAEDELAAVMSAMPEDLKALDGRRVSICGYAYPRTDENGRLLGFLLIPDHGLCCSGKPPPAHSVVCVFPGAIGKVPLDQPVQVTGVFSAGVRRTSFAEGEGCLMPWRLHAETLRLVQ